MLIDVVLLVVAVVVGNTRALILDEPKFVDNRERAATTHPHAYLGFVCVRCVLPCACLDWCCLASSCFLPCLASPCPTLPSSTNKEKAGRGRKEKRKKREREEGRNRKKGEKRKETKQKRRKGGREEGRNGER